MQAMMRCCSAALTATDSHYKPQLWRKKSTQTMYWQTSINAHIENRETTEEILLSNSYTWGPNYSSGAQILPRQNPP